jgi:acyl-CoA synthetase (NDP forming)
VTDRILNTTIQLVEHLLERVHADGRDMLFEHEVYAILESLGIRVPRHHFVTSAEQIDHRLLSRMTSNRVVLKAAAAGIAHKQKAGAVKVLVKDIEFLRYNFTCMQKALEAAGHRLEGILLVEFVDHSQDLGNEILLGFRESDAFGPVISFSKGGSDAEHFAANFSPPNLILAPIDHRWARALLYSTRIQKKYAAQGHANYTDQIIAAGLKFSDLAVAFSNFHDADSRFVIKEFEVNPFIFDPYGQFIALDGYARFEPRRKGPARPEPPPAETLKSFFEPQGVAVIGVSTQDMQAPGTIIAANLARLGRRDIYCINPKGGRIVLADEQQPVYASVAAVPAPVELAVVAVPARFVPEVVRECALKEIKAVILIPGGFSESGQATEPEEEILATARAHGMRLLGPNCLGVLYAGREHRPGINTFFVPEQKMQLPSGQNRRVALLNQSGALGITELHNLRHGISPQVIVSYGNQLDIDPSDLIDYFGRSPEIDVIGCYIEGFKAGAGERFYHAAARCPKPVIVYKAGRTAAGQHATQSHTASMAGEYAVAEAAMKQAGLVVADTVMAHKDLIKTFALLSHMRVTGNRVAVIANAGYEKTYAADHLGRLEVATLDSTTLRRLQAIVPPMVTADPLLDLTPMAGDALFEQCIEAMLQSDQVDSLLVSIVPQTPALATTDQEMAADPDNVAARIVRQFHKHGKPVAVSICITAGADVIYNRFGQTLEQGGVPTFLSAGQAMICLNAFIRYRMIRSTGNYSEWLIS